LTAHLAVCRLSPLEIFDPHQRQAETGEQADRSGSQKVFVGPEVSKVKLVQQVNEEKNSCAERQPVDQDETEKLSIRSRNHERDPPSQPTATARTAMCSKLLAA
jgi:hypothetical protein